MTLQLKNKERFAHPHLNAYKMPEIQLPGLVVLNMVGKNDRLGINLLTLGSTFKTLDSQMS
jgi:hypothetical protein